jgi:TonB family protein
MKYTTGYFSCFAFALLAVALAMSQETGDDPARDHAVLPESYARQSAIERVIPIYPEEAVRAGIVAIVHVKIEISRTGDVLKIKVKPRTSRLLSDSVADAVKQWRFKPIRGQDGLPMPSITRLIFRFSLQDGNGRVELYDPGPNASDSQRIGYCDSSKELKEWRIWEEIPINK